MLKYSWKEVVVSDDKSKICKEIVKINLWNKLTVGKLKRQKQYFLKLN